jgi:membrane protease YdiL (CAAX protease family)
MRRVLISILKILAFFAIWAAGLTAVTLGVVQVAGPDFYKNLPWRTAVEAGGLLAVLIALLVMALLVDKRPASTLGLPPRRALPGILMGTIVGVVLFCIPIGILTAMGYAHYAPDFSQFDPAVLGWLLLLVFVNVIDQELLVRSYLFQEIWSKYSGGAAVVISTIVFVALHAGVVMKGTAGLLAGADVAAASIMLGIAYLRTGALWLPIGIHFGWNALQGPVLGISVTGMDLGHQWHAFAINGPAVWTGGDLGVEGGLAGLAGPLVGILIVLVWPRSERTAESALT